MNNRSKLVILIVVLVFAGLAIGSFALTSDDDASGNGSDNGSQTDITLYLTFIPNVQFAPIYVAIENGYFADEGINVEIEYIDEPVIVDGLAIDDMQFGVISGEQVIIGRSVEKPVVYVYEWYDRFPVGLVVPADSEIETPEDLANRNISVPGAFGASYMGLLALLDSADLQQSDIEMESVGFNAATVMCERQVEGAIVYVANEPLQIAECYDVRVIEISEYVNLVANGLVTNEQTIENDPELVESMVRAFDRGLQFTIDNPETAFELSLNFIPDLSEDRYEVEQQVLINSIALWEAERLGETELAAWETTQEAMLSAETIRTPVEDLSAAFTNEFLPSLDGDAE